MIVRTETSGRKPSQWDMNMYRERGRERSSVENPQIKTKHFNYTNHLFSLYLYLNGSHTTGDCQWYLASTIKHPVQSSKSPRTDDEPYLQLNRSRTCAASPPPSSLLLHSGNGGGRVLLASLQQSLTEVATLLLMLRWRLEPTLPPLQHESARHSLSECERREKSFQISQLIAGVSRRGEKAWLWPLPHCVTTATATQLSRVTTQRPHPGNYAWPLGSNRSRAVGNLYETWGRRMSLWRFIARYFSNDKVFPGTVWLNTAFSQRWEDR